MQKVAIQGGPASFHHLAAFEYFRDELLEFGYFDTFRELFRSVSEGRYDYGISAVENTLVGSILPNYNLIVEFPLRIVGEIYLHISHNLIALPGQKVDNIRTVISHPMALLQCSTFLDRLDGVQIVESHDTADAVREIKEKGPKGIGAIASVLAAKLYEMDILASGIENLKKNYTRFWILSTNNTADRILDKASLNFKLLHRPGALADALEAIRTESLNLTLIQSLPIPDKPNEYAFHVDVTWKQGTDYLRCLDILSKKTNNLIIHGIYKSGELPYDTAGN